MDVAVSAAHDVGAWVPGVCVVEVVGVRQRVGSAASHQARPTIQVCRTLDDPKVAFGI